ncbi:hypothetical protein BC937DRAFT_87205, partial [Endogone sp. FLAS-F59071]
MRKAIHKSDTNRILYRAGGNTAGSSTVDAIPSFIEALDLFQMFLAKYSLFQDHTAAFVT